MIGRAIARRETVDSMVSVLSNGHLICTEKWDTRAACDGAESVAHVAAWGQDWADKALDPNSVVEVVAAAAI